MKKLIITITILFGLSLTTFADGGLFHRGSNARNGQASGYIYFNARTSDYASRFKVVFVAANEDTVGDNPTFAFESNGNWVIANEGRATLQVIDLNGRILSSEQINGCAETRINAAAGVYVMRLVNGEKVRTQKVVVR